MAKKKDARERGRFGPHGEPIGGKGPLDGVTGEGHGTAGGGKDARPGRGAWVPAQGSAGQGMPAQKRGRAERPAPESKEAPDAPRSPPVRDDGM